MSGEGGRRRGEGGDGGAEQEMGGEVDAKRAVQCRGEEEVESQFMY
jgi:hypothetical protein